MSYKVLARKWRPANFDELVGQSHVQKTLSSALENQRLHHAYLFTGTRGVGKTTIARIMAKCLNCEHGVTNKPCGECGSCVEISEGRFVDLIEVDAASKTKVDDTRELLENVQYRPSRGRYKIYLIDEVHMLSKHSFNALLKTLEEPPPHVIFLLATTDPQMLPPTVLSRCLQFHLKNMTQEEIRAHLSFILKQEQVEFEPAALEAIAWSAKGSMRDSLSLLDQAIAFGNGVVKEAEVKDMLGSIDRNEVNAMLLNLAEGKITEVLDQINIMDQYAPNYHDVLDEITQTWHRVALSQQVPDYLPESIDKSQIQSLAQQLDPQDVQLFYQIALTSKRDLHLAPTGRSGLEMSLLRMHSFKPGAIRQTGEPGAPVAEKKSQSSSELTSKTTETLLPQGQQNELPEHLNVPEHVAMTEESAPQEEAIQLADILGAEPADAPKLSSQQAPEQQASATKTTSQATSGWDLNSILRPIPEKAVDKTLETTAEKTNPDVAAELEPTSQRHSVIENEETPAATENRDHVAASIIEMQDENLAIKQEIEEQQQPGNVIPATVPDSLEISQLSDLNESNWFHIVDHLDLAGITEQIMLATQVQSVSDNRLVLHLESRLWNMLTAEQVNQISVLLHERFSSDFSVTIETENPRVETPGQRRQRLIEERLQAAVDQLETDPVVLSFKNKFNSHLDKASVEPIN